MKHHILLSLVCLLLLTGCAAIPLAEPTVTPTIPPTATFTAVPTSTPTPEPSATPTATRTATVTATPVPVVEEFIFAHFTYLAVDYDTAEWVSEKGMGQGMLIHQSIPGCEINDQAPDAPPSQRNPRQVDSIDFQVATLQNSQNNLTTIWYLLKSGVDIPAGASPKNPMVVVSAPEDHVEACQEQAEGVIASLHATP
jgi:hypothetical protein